MRRILHEIITGTNYGVCCATYSRQGICMPRHRQSGEAFCEGGRRERWCLTWAIVRDETGFFLTRPMRQASPASRVFACVESRECSCGGGSGHGSASDPGRPELARRDGVCVGNVVER